MQKGKMNGLDLFTGIGGISLALREWVEPVAYCEIDPYCQSVLLSRMQEGHLPKAPIWDDVRTFPNQRHVRDIDIIYGGFPCQDISIAGNGKGLAGERSGLFFEIIKLAKEIQPAFIFLENVPAITTRGGLQVVREVAEMGYDCRWCVISAASVGALHRRERWFLLGYSKHNGSSRSSTRKGFNEVHEKGELGQKKLQSIRKSKRTGCLSVDVANSKSKRLQGQRRAVIGSRKELSKPAMQSENVSDSNSISSRETDNGIIPKLKEEQQNGSESSGEYWPFKSRDDWQETVSTVCRVSDGISSHVDRLKALGNSVVPIQVTHAFKILMGLK